MKKLLVFFGMVLFAAPSFCQLAKLEGRQTANDKIRFGIKAGLSVANLKIEYGPAALAVPHQSRVGVLGGFFLQMPLRQDFKFQPELLLVGKGTKQHDGSYTERTGLTYLELPMNILYGPTNPKGSFFVGGGPAPAIFLGQNVFYSGNEYIKKFDLGFNILAGYEWPVGFSFNLHYTYGLVNISRDRTITPVTKNRCFGLSVGYLF